jgi:hypothetical protein
MKIVKLQGGLGNQMFQYAFSRALQAATGEDVFGDRSGLYGKPEHNVYELERVFGLDFPEPTPGAVERLAYPAKGLANRLLRKYLTKPTHIIDRKFGYQPELLTLPGDRYFEGYWQSEKYFSGIEATIRRDFSFKLPLSERNRAILAGLRRPAASVHVRRGDYLAHPNLDICTPAYYERAVAILRDLGISSFLVFSDDIPYCRTTLGLGGDETVFVDWNRGEDSWQDMALMARCDHNIIANSSFSWWAAWLNPSPAKSIVAPSVWNRRQFESRDRYYHFSFDDIVPAAWLRVDVN